MSSNIFSSNVEQLKKETEQMLVKTPPSTINSNSGDNSNHSNGNGHTAKALPSAQNGSNKFSSRGGGGGDNESISKREENDDDEGEPKEDMENNTPLLNNEDLSNQKQENIRNQELVRQSLEYKVGLLQKEQQRLARVNDELESIEHELAKDVEKLREMIDQLSRNIAFWEEDHTSKKKAYLESEKQLTTAKERRDNLTKHLQTIIMTNESRKANKLQQLMTALQEEAEETPQQADKSQQNPTTNIHDAKSKRNSTAQYSGPL